MKDYKKILKRLIFPPLWLQIILTIASAVALTAVFVNGLETHPVAYAVYVVAFYTVSVVSVFCATVLPKHYKHAKQRVYDNELGNRYMTDAVFRTHVSLFASLSVNLLYVATNVLSGLLYRSAWFWVLSVYYVILAVMRFLLVRYVGRNKIGDNLIGEWKRARVCACILTLINLALSGAILMIMYQNKGYEYGGILIYVMAMYTFYITTLAIINIVKYRKYNSPILSMTKIITLAAALVSMLSLETAMLTEFGSEMTELNKRIFIAATGAGISVVVLTLSSYMIIRSTKEIRKHEG
ncbi:MAG: hypothetical protein IJ519_04590 [Clostridia bacterium]|nr:hypothetical protein [Clostridia bacterium]